MFTLHHNKGKIKMKHRVLMILICVCLLFSLTTCSGSVEKTARVRPDYDISKSLEKRCYNEALAFLSMLTPIGDDYKITENHMLLSKEDEPIAIIYSYTYGKGQEGYVVVEFGNKNPYINIAGLEPSPFNNAPEGVYYYFEPPMEFFYQYEDSFTFISTDTLE